MKISQGWEKLTVSSKACLYYNRITIVIDTLSLYLQRLHNYNVAKIFLILLVHVGLYVLHLYMFLQQFDLENEIRCLIDLNRFNLRMSWSWTQETPSKIIKRFVPSFARKTCRAQFPASETNQLGKPQRGNCQKKRMDEGVDVRCQSGAMRMAIRTCWALYRSKAVGMRHWCLTLTTVLAQSLPDSWTWSLRLSILCFCLQCAAAGSSQGPGSSEGTRLLLENGRGR